MCPPPGPFRPWSREFGPCGTKQQASEPDSDSSKVTIEQPVSLVRLRLQDPGHPLPQEVVDAGIAAALRGVRAHLVVAVAAQIGRDEAVVAGALRLAEIVAQLLQVHDVGGAGGAVVDDRVEVHERVVPGRVLVGRRGLLSGVGGPDRRVRTGGAPVPGRVLAHVLHVAAPGLARRLELVGDRTNFGRVDAAGPERLPVRADRPGRNVIESAGAIGLRHRVLGLAADQGDVVAEAEVPRAVVLAEQPALRGQLAREVGGLGGRVAEGRVVVLVLEHDREDVLDLRRVLRRGCVRHPPEHAGERREDREAEAHLHSTSPSAFGGSPLGRLGISTVRLNSATSVLSCL